VMTEEEDQSFVSGDDREMEDGDEGTRTLPTTGWSVQSSPGRTGEDVVMGKEMEWRVGRVRGFGDGDSVDEGWEGRRGDVIPNRTSVGVAF